MNGAKNPRDETYWVHGRLDLIGNDKLDGGRFERILRIEPDHEVKDFVLETTGAISDDRRMIGKGVVSRQGRRCAGARGVRA